MEQLRKIVRWVLYPIYVSLFIVSIVTIAMICIVKFLGGFNVERIQKTEWPKAINIPSIDNQVVENVICYERIKITKPNKTCLK